MGSGTGLQSLETEGAGTGLRSSDWNATEGAGAESGASGVIMTDEPGVNGRTPSMASAA